MSAYSIASPPRQTHPVSGLPDAFITAVKADAAGRLWID
jgi:hypothetical protein